MTRDSYLFIGFLLLFAAVNAALLTASVLGLSDEAIAAALDDFRTEQTANVPENPED